MFIYSYKFGSQSAKDLAQNLGAKRVRHNGSRFRARPGKTVINWGCSNLPDRLTGCNIINPPTSVGLAANKLQAFRSMQGEVSIPEFTTNKEGALEGLWVARTKLSGHSGDGIVIVENGDGMVDAPLYVKYIKKKYEYRVHVAFGEVIHVQRKARNTKIPDDQINWRVRNHCNGFIFTHNEDHEVRGDTLDQAKKAVHSLGLDFGAVDIIWNERDGQAYVLEVNTAPGLTSTTLDKYVEAFRGR